MTPAGAPPPDRTELAKLARAARKNAVAPFSKFKVGAALRLADGSVVTGCNIENATYGLTLCAERVAIFKAVSEGESTFAALAIVADSPRLPAPCGACRQIIWEFCGDIWIRLSDLKGRSRQLRMSELLPHPFDRRNL